MRLLLAILSGLIGIVLLFGGYRLARFLIPLFGFISGLALGGAVVADMTSSSFLATALGIFVGICLGLLFGALAYFYYYFAVVVLAGALGYWLGNGFVQLFGFDPGFLSALVGMVAGVAVGIASVAMNAPRYVLIVLTSIAGAVSFVGGLMLLFRQIPLEAYSYTAAHVAISNSFIWAVVALITAAVGMAIQAQTTPSSYVFDEWTTDAGNKTPPGTTHAPTA